MVNAEMADTKDESKVHKLSLKGMILMPLRILLTGCRVFEVDCRVRMLIASLCVS